MSRPAAVVRIESLDGLRGVAISLVMLYHMTLLTPLAIVDEQLRRLAQAGWCGVDLFFVLSGFLITGILLDSRHEPGYFRNFWARRILRIVPLYYAVLAFCLLVLPHFDHAKAANFARIRGDEVWYWVYLQNFTIAEHGFRHGILDVTWSLAIEEQFYLAWPFLVLALSGRRLAFACIALIVMSISFRIALQSSAATDIAIYVLTPGRVDGLAIGSLIAVAVREGQWERLRKAAPVAAAVALIALAPLYVDCGLDWACHLTQAAGFTLLAILFGAMLVMAIDPANRSLWHRALESRVLRSIGKYSYAMYLFHLPLRALVRDRVFGPEQFGSVFGSAIPGQLLFYAISGGITFIAAWISWHLFERRMLALKRFFPYGHVHAVSSPVRDAHPADLTPRAGP